MQLRKTVWMLTALSALSLVMTGCPGDEGDTTCSSATDCAEGETCHPVANVCVTTCSIAADCPSEEKLCAPLAGSTDSVCQCQNDALCNPGGGTDMVCSNLEKRCVERCTSDANCGSGQTCNVTSGQCEGGGNTGDTCTGTSKSTCDYGEFCSNTKCEAAPVAPTTCENFPSNDRPAWSATANNGPVIYSTGFERYEVNSSLCSSGDAFVVRVKAYRTDADWPDNRQQIAGFFYVTTGTTEFDIINSGLLVPNTGYTRNANNRKDADFLVYHCRPANSTRLQVGYYFTGGNPVCADIVKQ